jgi:peptide/nickel transport system permease protein
MWAFILKRFFKHRLAVISLFLLIGLSLATCIIPTLNSMDPFLTQASNSLQPPSLMHLFGTDDMGRDILGRILYGGRASLSVGLIATVIAVILGIIIGSLSGYIGGVIDNILMRFTDIFLSFPTIFVVLLLNLLLRESNLSFLRTGIFSVACVIGIMSWMELARLVRSSFLSLREIEFVKSSVALGASNLWVVSRHILPNGVGPIIVSATLIMASSVLMESGLSYLGFGVQPPTPTWGNMLNKAQTYFYFAPWLAIFPGLMICITVIAINSIGDGLRDAFDPHL